MERVAALLHLLNVLGVGRMLFFGLGLGMKAVERSSGRSGGRILSAGHGIELGLAAQRAFSRYSCHVKNISSKQGDDVEAAKGELHQALTETRHLQATIAAMRTELEKNQVEKAEAVQSAVSECHDEIRQLQNTIQILRDGMQAMAAENAQSLQALAANGRDERHQLEGTITALRAGMEDKMFLHAEELEKQSRADGEEMSQLRETIAALRTLLEKNNAS